jgi:hypothetical protein
MITKIKYLPSLHKFKVLRLTNQLKIGAYLHKSLSRNLEKWLLIVRLLISDFLHHKDFLGSLNRSRTELIIVIGVGLTAIPIPLVDLTCCERKHLSKLLHLGLAPVDWLFELCLENQSLIQSLLKPVRLLMLARVFAIKTLMLRPVFERASLNHFALLP